MDVIPMKDVDLEEGVYEEGGGVSGSKSKGEGDLFNDVAEAQIGVSRQGTCELSPRRSERETEGDVEAGVSTGARERPPDGGMGGAMQGVGEDEKAYNYICNLDKVNLGGPGWFNDVFTISVEVDSDRTWMDTLSLSLVPRNVFKRHCKLLDTSQHISGTVTVEAPTSKRVWLSGVTVTFEEHLITVDSDTGELVGALEAQVALGQFVSGKITFNFNLDLALLDGHRRWPVRETYVGDLMALRHRLLVSAQRPWYTFNVYSQVPLAMESLSAAPLDDAGQENEEGGPNHVLIISDCNGRCEFDFGVDSFNLGDPLRGTVRFSEVTAPIVAAHVMLLKAEFLYGEASEVLMAEHTILGPRRRQLESASRVGLSEEEKLRRQFMSPFVEQQHVHFVQTEEHDCRMEAVVGDVDLPVDFPLEDLPISPSYMSLTQDITAVNDEAELVGVRYYLRLILEDSSQQAFWHTHEVFFHRSEPSLSSRGRNDANSDDFSGNEDYDSEEERVGAPDDGSDAEPLAGQGEGNNNGRVTLPRARRGAGGDRHAALPERTTVEKGLSDVEGRGGGLESQEQYLDEEGGGSVTTVEGTEETGVSKSGFSPSGAGGRHGGP